VNLSSWVIVCMWMQPSMQPGSPHMSSTIGNSLLESRSVYLVGEALIWGNTHLDQQYTELTHEQ
jgi:hypothetical protein